MVDPGDGAQFYAIWQECEPLSVAQTSPRLAEAHHPSPLCGKGQGVRVANPP